MNKIFKLLFLAAIITAVCAFFMHNAGCSGLGLAIVMTVLYSLLIIFMQDPTSDNPPPRFLNFF